MQHTIFASLVIVFVIVSPVSATDPFKKLKNMNTTDGISRSEAKTITNCYFKKHIGCGTWTDIKETPNYWDVSVLFGYAGTPRPFHINKTSGAITTDVGPNYEDPKDLLKPKKGSPHG